MRRFKSAMVVSVIVGIVATYEMAARAQRNCITAHQFAVALTDSMEAFIGAEDLLNEEKPAEDSLSLAVTTMTNLRTAISKFSFASTRIGECAASSDTVIARFAEHLSQSYADLTNVYRRKLALAETLLLKPVRDDPAKLAIETSKVNSTGDQVFELLNTTIADSMLALIDSNREDRQGHATYLKLTAAERADIARRLRGLAGDSPQDTSKDASRPVARIPALMVWRWLIKPEWHPADLK